MVVVRNEGTGNMLGKKSLKSDNPYNKLMRTEALCEEYEEEIAALEDEIEELKKERDELQKEFAKYSWVSVKDRLPDEHEESKMVIVLSETGLGTSRYQFFKNREWTSFGEKITHWLPIPTPPKENSNE